MRRTRIAVFVSGSGTNLQSLINASKDGRLSAGEIALVVSNKEGAYALNRAAENGIPSAVFNGKKIGFEAGVTPLLESRHIDMIVLAGFLKVLSKSFIERWEGRIINIHPSLIPSFCGDGYYGLRVHEAALQRGVKWTGATVHYVNDITDGGEIIIQKPVEVLPNDTPEILQKRVLQEAEWVILPQAAEIVSKKLQGADQNG